MTGRQREATYPHLVGVIGASAFLLYVFYGENRVPDDISNVLLQTISFAGLLAGFLYTSISLLLTLGNSPYVRRIIRMNVIRRLVDQIWKAVRQWIIVAILSLLIVFLDQSLTTTGYIIAISLWAYCVTLAFATFIKTASLTNQILKDAMDPKQFQDNGGGDTVQKPSEEPVTIQ